MPSHPTATGSQCHSLVLDEGAPFAIGNQAICKRVRRQPDRMARPLAVEGETRAAVTDLYRTLRPSIQRNGSAAALMRRCQRA